MEDDAVRELAEAYKLLNKNYIELTDSFNNALKIIAKYRSDLGLVKLSDKDLKEWVIRQ